MLNKKIMMLAILIVGLLAVSAVSAAENVTSDVIGLDDGDEDAIGLDNENSDEVESSVENDMISSSDDEIYSVTETSLTTNQKSFICYYGTGFDLDYEFTQESDGDDVGDSKIEIRIYTGNSYKSFYETIEKTYDASSFILQSSMYVNCPNVKVGTHKLEAYIDGHHAFTKNLVVKKSSVSYKDYNVRQFKYKQNKYYQVEVWNKKTYDPVRNAYFKVKVYTGSKYVTYKIKTKISESCSWIKIPTKNLKVGTHKVVITSYDNSYSGTFNGKISIYSASKTTPTKTSNTMTVTKGKYKATFSKSVWNQAKKSPGMWDKQVKNTGVKKYNGKTVTAYIYTYGNKIGVCWNAGGYQIADKYLGQTSVRYQDLQ